MHSHPYRDRHRHLGFAPRVSKPVLEPGDGSVVGPGRNDRPSGHSHGLVDDSVRRSDQGLRAVTLSLGVLGVTAAFQTAAFVASGSVALLADLIHNFGDALTAVPLGIAFVLHSIKAERRAGFVVVAAIGLSACVAGVEAGRRLWHPITPGSPRRAGHCRSSGIRRQLVGRSDPHPGWPAPREPRVDRGWASRTGRRVREPERRRIRRGRCDWTPSCGCCDRARNHSRHPSYHLAIVAGGSRSTRPVAQLSSRAHLARRRRVRHRGARRHQENGPRTKLVTRSRALGEGDGPKSARTWSIWSTGASDTVV